MPIYDFYEVFARELLYHLVIRGDFQAWRLRKVEKIAPKNLTSYESRVSYQFVIPSSFVYAAYNRIIELQQQTGQEFVGFDSHPLTIALSEGRPISTARLKIILPLCLLSKRVLLGFSVHDEDGKPLTLKTRFDGSMLTREILATQLEIMDLKDFFDSAPRLLHSFAFIGPRDVARNLMRFKVPLRPKPPYARYRSALAAFITNAIERYFVYDTQGDEALARLIHEEWERITEVISLSSCLINRLVQAGHRLWHHGFHNPLTNPLMACLDYYKLTIRDNPDYARLSPHDRLEFHRTTFHDFINECLNYVQRMNSLQNEVFYDVYDLLFVFSEFYFAYVNVSINPDTEFLAKMEQTVQTVSRDKIDRKLLYDPSYWPRALRWRPWRRIFTRHCQVYPLVLGDSQTTHVEIESRIPTELEQVRKKTRLEIEGATLRTEEIFGYSSDPEGKAVTYQHFYTTKTVSEIRDILRRRQLYQPRPVAESIPIDLLVKFRAHRSILWTYRMTSVLAIALTLVFLRSFVDTGTSTGSWTELPRLIVPLALAIMSIVARLRPQQSITADVLKGHIFVILGCTFFVILFFVISLSSSFLADEWLSFIRSSIQTKNKGLF